MKNYSIVLMLFILTFCFTMSAYALELELNSSEPEIKTVHIDQNTVFKGYTVENSNQRFRLGFLPEVLSGPTSVTFKDFDKNLFSYPEGKTAVSNVYEFDLSKGTYDQVKPLMLEILTDVECENLLELYFYNGVAAEWQKLPTRSTSSTGIRSLIHLPYAKLVVLQDQNIVSIGQASWYAYKGCNCAASPDFEKGTKLKVTNLDNNKSVIVEVNDYGPDRSVFPQRVIDLDKVAFKAIGELWQGVLQNVKVELASN